ncbi:hypothetical protein [Actinacidiphila sp. ITFR-21]|uniref:hypothetical protein n=1 Tax=Actinacidiphila sp. ITFR-21 TaxID=3075199 RepID=UPI0028892C51|nr:hypothetical protein [Streptomyces sp. ITFR-21]WNI20350.1 hypothetical protein RLT57_32625 [Streptomyces sp. ITFR-21]
MTSTGNAATVTLPEQSGELLPPYTGEMSPCAKCANPEAFTRYRPALGHGLLEVNGVMTRGPLPERLERTCQRCDYQWDEALAPAPGTRPAAAEEFARALEQSHAGWALDLSPECAEHMAARLLEVMAVRVPLDFPAGWGAGPRPLFAAPPPAAPAAIEPGAES